MGWWDPAATCDVQAPSLHQGGPRPLHLWRARHIQQPPDCRALELPRAYQIAQHRLRAAREPRPRGGLDALPFTVSSREARYREDAHAGFHRRCHHNSEFHDEPGQDIDDLPRIPCGFETLLLQCYGHDGDESVEPKQSDYSQMRLHVRSPVLCQKRIFERMGHLRRTRSGGQRAVPLPGLLRLPHEEACLVIQ